MEFASIFEKWIATLVHPRVVRGSIEHARQIHFVGLRLAPSLIALVALPVRLAHGVPAFWEMTAVLLLQGPLLATFVLARGGSLRVAQAISACGLVGFGCVIALAAPHLQALAYIAFVLVLIETAGLFDMRFGTTAMLGILAMLAAIPLLRDTLMPPLRNETSDPVVSAVALFLALAYAAALLWSEARLEALRQSHMVREEARYQALTRAIGDLVLHIDRRGAVLACSTEAGAMFALTPRDFSGPGFYERLHLADRPAFLQALSDAFDDLTTPPAVLRLRTTSIQSTRGDFHESVYASIEMRVRRMRHDDASDDDASATAVCLIRDITKQKAREDEAANARRLAEQAEETRERFLANVSHELRTPLNAIIGFADLLRMDKVRKDEATRAEYAGIISASGQHLLSVVNSILDMSKLEAGSFGIEPAQFEPAALLDSCLDIVRLKAAESGVNLVRDYNDTLAPIIGDERACRQIFINLLSNAVKFTPKDGTVTLSARENLGFTVVVEDTGIGICASDMPRLGDAFFQASNARSRLYEGTGLGLSLVRGLVGLHGGTIDVASAPGNGTAVTVHLPADCLAAAPARTPIVIQTFPRTLRAPTSPQFDKVKNIA